MIKYNVIRNNEKLEFCIKRLVCNVEFCWCCISETKPGCAVVTNSPKAQWCKQQVQYSRNQGLRL